MRRLKRVSSSTKVLHTEIWWVIIKDRRALVSLRYVYKEEICCSPMLTSLSLDALMSCCVSEVQPHRSSTFPESRSYPCTVTVRPGTISLRRVCLQERRGQKVSYDVRSRRWRNSLASKYCVYRWVIMDAAACTEPHIDIQNTCTALASPLLHARALLRRQWHWHHERAYQRDRHP